MLPPIDPIFPEKGSQDAFISFMNSKIDDLNINIIDNEKRLDDLSKRVADNGKSLADNGKSLADNEKKLDDLSKMSLAVNLKAAEDSQFEKPTIKSLDDLPKDYEHTYTVLDKIFNDDASVKIGSLGGRNIIWTNVEGKQRNEVSLRSAAKKINHIISKTKTFTTQDREVVSRVANKINAMWQKAEELIKGRNIFMRILFHLGKIFSWKVLVTLPKQEIDSHDTSSALIEG